MKPLYHPYNNGVVPFDREFTQENLEECAVGILFDYKEGKFSELMDTRKWLGLCLNHVTNVLDGYKKGVEFSGAPILTGSELCRSETLHFQNKKNRIEKAIEICDKYTPFEVIEV